MQINVEVINIAEGMKCAFHMRVGVKDGNYYAVPRFVLDGDVPYEDISLIKVDLGKEADYSDMANYYREYQLKRGACIPLKERVKDNPQLKYAVDAPEIRIRWVGNRLLQLCLSRPYKMSQR